MTRTVRDTGTLAVVSPRAREKLSTGTLNRLRAAQDGVHASEAALRLAVMDACAESSVRVVAEAMGVSPTTVQKWKSEAR